MRSEQQAGTRAMVMGALAALAGCVELDVTRVSSSDRQPPPRGSATAQPGPTSGYLCVVMTPSLVKSLFVPEWKRLTVAIVTPSRKAATKAVVDFSGFTKEGAPGAFPCVPVEGTEPIVIAFDVEGHHGSVERAAQETLAAVSDAVSSVAVPLKPTAKVAGGLEGVLLSNGVATVILGGDGWCAGHPNSCFASFSTARDATTTIIVGPRGSAPGLRGGRLVDEGGRPTQGVAITLDLEPSPRPQAIPADCVAALERAERAERSQFSACASSSATSEMTRGDARAFTDLISALALAASDALGPTTRAVALKEARSAVCWPGRFDVACARAASMERELVDLGEGEDAEASLRILPACDSAAMASALLEAASARLARHAVSSALRKQTADLGALVHESRVACFKERAIAGCGPDCPLGWLSKVTSLSGARLLLGYDEEGCRANSLRAFVANVKSAAAGLTVVEEIRETVRAAAAPDQEKVTNTWCSDVARLSEVLKTSRLFREMDEADRALRGLSAEALDVEVDEGAPDRYAGLKGRPPAGRVAALLEESESLKKRLPGLFGSADDGAPKLRDGAQDRLESDVNAHTRFVRAYVERAMAKLAAGHSELRPTLGDDQVRDEPALQGI